MGELSRLIEEQMKEIPKNAASSIKPNNITIHVHIHCDKDKSPYELADVISKQIFEKMRNMGR